MTTLRKPSRDDYDKLYRERRDARRPGWTTDPQLEADRRHLAVGLESGLLPRSGRLLELGCGAGNIGLHLAGRGYDVSGIDLSAEAIAWARDNAASAGVAARFVAGDVTRPAVLDEVGGPGRFDVVLDGHCLHFVPRDDRAGFFAVARLALAPGGVLWVRSMCNDTPGATLAPGGHASGERLHVYDPATRTLRVDDVAVATIPSAAELFDEVARAGFDVLLRHVVPAVDEDDLDEAVCLARLAGGDGG